MKLFVWFIMLSKRLYKKLTFLAILILIPLLVLGYHAAAKEDSGMLTVALTRRSEDALADRIMEALADSTRLIRYVKCESPDKAEELVRYGKADSAWIFEDDLQARMDAFLANPTQKNAMATVLVRQDDVTLMLAREKLSGELYRVLCQYIYIAYVRQNVPGLSHMSDGELMEYYHTSDIAKEMFSFDQTGLAATRTVSHLTAPVRGMLGVLILLCGMATAMYYVTDCRRGTFAWVSSRMLPAVELGCQAVSLVNVSAVALATLALAGQTVGIGRELAATALYCLCAAAFCMFLRRLCGSVRILATLLPLLVVVMLVVCPVFFDFAALRDFQYLLPPTYYVNAVYNIKYLGYMALYTLACFGLYGLLGIGRRNTHGSL